MADLYIPSRILSIKEWRILILSYIKFSTLKYRGKQQIFLGIRSDFKIADSHLIGYNHVLLRHYESERFNVLYSVGISSIFKLFIAHFHYWLF